MSEDDLLPLDPVTESSRNYLKIVKGNPGDAPEKQQSPPHPEPAKNAFNAPRTSVAALADATSLENASQRFFSDEETSQRGSFMPHIEDYGISAAEGTPSIEGYHLDELLKICQEFGGSDLHITTGLPPMARKDGKICPLRFQPLSGVEVQQLVYDILTREQIEKFELTKELDFSYGVRGRGRYRFRGRS